MMNKAAGGNAQLLADLISSSLQPVSNDLTLLPGEYSVETYDAPCQYVIQSIEVFDKLQRISVHKSLHHIA